MGPSARVEGPSAEAVVPRATLEEDGAVKGRIAGFIADRPAARCVARHQRGSSATGIEWLGSVWLITSGAPA
jgi:hypothetical protein